MKKRILMLIAISLLFVGCAHELPDYVLPSKQTEQTEATSQAETGDTSSAAAEEWREYTTYPVDLDVDALLGHTDHEILFLQGKYAQYFDVELGRYFAFCSQPNCVHNDESCPSYFGGDSVMDTDYVVSGDSVYAACVEGETHLRLRQLKPLTGEKTDLWTLDLPEFSEDTAEDGTPLYIGYYFEDTNLMHTGNTLLLQYSTSCQKPRFEQDRQLSDSTRVLHCLRYDLRTGRAEDLLSEDYICFENSYAAPGGILDASDRYTLLSAGQAFSKPPMTKEEFMAAGGDEDAYFQYIGRLLIEAHQTMEIQVWDLETGEKVPLCNMNDLRMDSDRALDHHRVCYLKNEHEIWRVDLADGSQRKLLDFDGNIGRIEQWDGRVFFAAWKPQEDGTALWDEYWYDPATEELRQWAGDVRLCPFSICAETDRYFIGLTEAGGCDALDKQHFYNGDFAAAKQVGHLTLVN